jgi:hypothetical protein
MAPATWTGIVRATLQDAYQDTKDDVSAADEMEANAIKYLFHPSQAWTRQQGNDFIVAAWAYIGFG